MQTLLIDKMISVSIIIPVYNVEQYIESCLLSVINQNYKGDIECVIVNDCTPDQSMVVVHKILSDYDGNILFKIVDHKENRGLSASRNSGVRVATGDYLYFLDSDDILAKNAIALLADLALKDLPDVVMGDFELIGSNQNIPQLKTTITHFNIQKDIFNAFISYELYEMAWNKLVKRQFFYRHELWFCEGLIHEDSLWSFLLFYYCASLRICVQKTYGYRIRENSIMTDPRNVTKSLKSYYEIFFLKIEFIKKNALFEEFPLLIKYMIDTKYLLRRILVEQDMNDEMYTKLGKEMGGCYTFRKGLTNLTRAKILLSNLPFGIFKFLTSHIYNTTK